MDIKSVGGSVPIPEDSNQIESGDQTPISQTPEETSQPVSDPANQSKNVLSNLNLEGQMMRGKLDDLLPVDQEPHLDSEDQKLGEMFDDVLHNNQMRADGAKGTLKLSSNPVPVPEKDLDKFQIRHIKYGEPERIVVSTFPNGVRIARNVPDPNLMPPFGGETKEMKNGDLVAKDATGHVVAKWEKQDKSLHVFTKHGEFIEKNDWSVSFKSSDGTKDWEALHKAGPIPASKLEDYGVQVNGRNVIFANGLDVQLPDSHDPYLRMGALREEKTTVNGEVQEKGYDADNKLLYTMDSKGIHVPMNDGILTRSPDGKFSFEPKKN